MKNHLFLFAGLILFSFETLSQKVPVNEPDYNKPLLFAGVENLLPVKDSLLLSIFSYASGSVIQIRFSDKFIYSGILESYTTKTGAEINTVIIRSGNRPGSNFTLSKIINRDTGISFVGRIISFNHNDCFVLVDEGNTYWLKKIKRYDLILE